MPNGTIYPPTPLQIIFYLLQQQQQKRDRVLNLKV